MDDDQIHHLASQKLSRKDGTELWPQSTIDGRKEVLETVMSLLRIESETRRLLAGDPAVAYSEASVADDEGKWNEAAYSIDKNARLRRTDGPETTKAIPLASKDSSSATTTTEDATEPTKSRKREEQSPAMALRRGRLLCTIILRKGGASQLFTASAYDDGYDDGRGMLRLVMYDPALSTGASVELTRYECELIVGVRTDLLCEERRKDMASFILKHHVDVRGINVSHTHEDYPPRIGKHYTDGKYELDVSGSREFSFNRVTPLRPTATPLQTFPASVPIVKRAHPSGTIRKICSTSARLQMRTTTGKVHVPQASIVTTFIRTNDGEGVMRLRVYVPRSQMNCEIVLFGDALTREIDDFNRQQRKDLDAYIKQSQDATAAPGSRDDVLALLRKSLISSEATMAPDSARKLSRFLGMSVRRRKDFAAHTQRRDRSVQRGRERNVENFPRLVRHASDVEFDG